MHEIAAEFILYMDTDNIIESLLRGGKAEFSRPRGIKIPGPYGKTLVWHAVELARLIAQRVAERDASENEEGAPSRERPSDSTSPFAAGGNINEQITWIYPPSAT